MADVYCQRCGEPWELYYIEHEMTPEERDNFWEGIGCPSCIGKEVEKRPFRAELASAMRDVLGDDIDGIAAEMEDAEFAFGEKFWE